MAQQTKYNMVKQKITEWITSGEVKPGDKIYSENELVKLFHVSRHTIRQAIGDLVHEGWLYREQGAGTFCAHRLEPTATKSFSLPPIKHKGNIGIIVTEIDNYIFPSILKGIESHLSQHGYSLQLTSSNNDVEKERQCLQSMLSRNIDGLIVEPIKCSGFNPTINYYLELEQNHLPYLMINQFYPQISPPHLVVDDELGGYIATEHLIHNGHQRILGIFKTDDFIGMNRMKGFIQAYKDYSIPFFQDMIITYTTDKQTISSIPNLEAIFSSENKPSAIVCHNDQLAHRIIHYLRAKNLSVPEDISIVSYDDSILAEAFDVKLTSVAHPKLEMGIAAANWMMEAIEKRGIIPPSIVFKPKLVIRNSTTSIAKER